MRVRSSRARINLIGFCFLLTTIVILIWIHMVFDFSGKRHASSNLAAETHLYRNRSQADDPVESDEEIENCCLKRVKSSRIVEHSTCGDEATAAGGMQKVVSYSLYAPPNGKVEGFLEGLKFNLDAIRKFYPGWVARVYTNIPRNKFCKFLCQYTFLYWCDIGSVPLLGNLTKIDQRSWRFLPLGDPLVDLFISRDLDSRIYPRERAAVEEWENSNYTIHTMRDHPLHSVSMLGGMWGAKNTLLGSERAKRLQRRIVEEAETLNMKGWDQRLLDSVIYEELSDETMAHDSYWCDNYPDGVALPFPTRRENSRFVGSVDDSPMDAKYATCPEQCRRNLEWTNC